MCLVGRARLARRVVDAQARTADIRGANPDLADFRTLGMQHRRDQAAEPELLGIGHPSAGSEEKREQNREANPAHAAMLPAGFPRAIAPPLRVTFSRRIFWQGCTT